MKRRVAALHPAVYSNPRRAPRPPRRRFTVTLSAPVADALDATGGVILRRAGLRFTPEQLFRYAALSGIALLPDVLCSDGVLRLVGLSGRPAPTVAGLLAQAEALARASDPLVAAAKRLTKRPAKPKSRKP